MYLYFVKSMNNIRCLLAVSRNTLLFSVDGGWMVVVGLYLILGFSLFMFHYFAQLNLYIKYKYLNLITKFRFKASYR